MYVVVDWAVNTGAAIAHPPHTLENSAAGSTAEHIISWNAAFSTAAQSHTHTVSYNMHTGYARNIRMSRFVLA